MESKTIDKEHREMMSREQKKQARRMSKSQFNDRYVRSNKGHRDEIRNASDESLEGTRSKPRRTV